MAFSAKELLHKVAHTLRQDAGEVYEASLKHVDAIHDVADECSELEAEAVVAELIDMGLLRVEGNTVYISPSRLRKSKRVATNSKGGDA